MMLQLTRLKSVLVSAVFKKKLSRLLNNQQPLMPISNNQMLQNGQLELENSSNDQTIIHHPLKLKNIQEIR